MTREDYNNFILNLEKIENDLDKRLKNFAAINKAVGQVMNNLALRELGEVCAYGHITEFRENEIEVKWHETWNYGGYENHCEYISLDTLFNLEKYLESFVGESNTRLTRSEKERIKEVLNEL